MVARATPDGHTIGMIDAAYLINPSLFATLPYDSLKDFGEMVKWEKVVKDAGVRVEGP